MADLSSVIADLRASRFACIVEKEPIDSDTLGHYRTVGRFNIALYLPTEIQDRNERLRFTESWRPYLGRVLIWIRPDELDVIEAFAPCDRYVYTDEGLLHMDYEEE